MPVIWIPRTVAEEIAAGADHWAPLETGGAFIGRLAGADYEVTAYIGPGPKAIHELTAFQPDYDYQEAEIARLYERSGRRDTYLGDWHSHPADYTPVMSSDDRQVLKQIAMHPEARIERPVMAIYTPKSKTLRAWSGWIVGRWWKTLRTADLQVQLLDA